MFEKLDKNEIYKISFFRKASLLPSTWLGGLIRIFARIKYNHTGVLYYMPIKKCWCLQEAIGDGVVMTSFLNSNAFKYYTDYEIGFLKPQGTLNMVWEISQRMLEIEGKRYDFKGLLWHQLWLSLFNKWIGRAVKDGDRYYCYEAVAYVFGIDKKKPRDINDRFITIEYGKIDKNYKN